MLGTFHDTLQPEAFYEAANETLKLNEATGAFTQMLEQTGVMSVDEFNQKLAECNTVQEKQALMLEVSNQAMGKAGEAYNKSTTEIQKQREAQAAFTVQLAKVGEAVAPLIVSFISFGADALAIVTPYLKQIAKDYGPKLEKVLSEISEALKPIIAFIADHLPVIAGIAGIILGIAAAYKTYTAAMEAYNAVKTAYITITTIATAAQTAFGAANIAALAPILAVVAAIAAVIAIIVVAVKHWDEIKETVKKVANSIKEHITDMKNAVVNKFTEIKDGISNKVEAVKTKVTNVFNAVKSAITKPVETARDAVKNAIDKIKGFFNFSWSLPKLKLPTISIKGKFSLTPPSVPKFSISWNKLGGVFDKPTLFSYGDSLQGLGEDGAEAVVPLEKNTQWLDKLAERLAAKQNGVPIILQVDGKTFAQVSIDSINALTKQRGTLGLNLI